MATDAIDLGHGVIARFTSCTAHGTRTGAIIEFGLEDTPGYCEGLVTWCGCCEPAWTLVSLDPLHLDPSVACATHPEHHGWIRDGRWIPC